MQLKTMYYSVTVKKSNLYPVRTLGLSSCSDSFVPQIITKFVTRRKTRINACKMVNNFVPTIATCMNLIFEAFLLRSFFHNIFIWRKKLSYAWFSEKSCKICKMSPSPAFFCSFRENLKSTYMVDSNEKCTQHVLAYNLKK